MYADGEQCGVGRFFFFFLRGGLNCRRAVAELVSVDRLFPSDVTLRGNVHFYKARVYVYRRNVIYPTTPNSVSNFCTLDPIFEACTRGNRHHPIYENIDSPSTMYKTV